MSSEFTLTDTRTLQTSSDGLGATGLSLNTLQTISEDVNFTAVHGAALQTTSQDIYIEGAAILILRSIQSKHYWYSRTRQLEDIVYDG